MVKRILVILIQGSGLVGLLIQKEKKKRMIEKKLMSIGRKILKSLHLFVQIEEK